MPARRLVLLAPALIVLLLHACASAPPVASPRAEILAGQRATAGDFVGAARDYLAVSASATPPRQQELQLRAATLLLRAGQIAQAKSVLRRVATKNTAPAIAAEKQVLAARLAVLENEPEEALEQTAALTGLDPALAAERYAARAEAYRLLDDPLAAARERAALDELLIDPAARQANRKALYGSLLQVPVAAVQAARAGANLRWRGWLDRALLDHERTRQPRGHAERLAAWRARYPGHPAGAGDALPAASAAVRTDGKAAPAATVPTPANQVALLLPLSGPFAVAGEAVRHGVLAAWYASSADDRPVLKLYDSAAGGVVELYRQAIDEGARLAIGPLVKEQVQTLAASKALATPVLALNYLEGKSGAPQGFYQFGLLPEDEAVQVAERAVLDGRARAVVLVPRGDWGERMRNAFRDRLTMLGGTLVRSAAYDPKAADFTQPVLRALGSGKNAAPDYDFIFLAAFPAQARALRPQLAFHAPAALPVYATSHIYSGQSAPQRDRELDGIVFCDLPWLLPLPADRDRERAALRTAWPEAVASEPRLHALGVDAFRLAEALPALRPGSSVPFAGMTGSLHLIGPGRVYRQLRWARFVDGVPQVLGAGE